MDHVVYVDFKAGEMESLLSGEKTMIVRGAAGRKMPYGRVSVGDVLYFINNNAEGVVQAKGVVNSVINSEKLTLEESILMIEQYQKELQLNPSQKKRWGGKRYLVLMKVKDVRPINPLSINKNDYGNMDDWLPVDDISSVRIG